MTHEDNPSGSRLVDVDASTVQIHPTDADQVLIAGVQFARALAGAEGATFMVALGEQAASVQAAIVRAGFPAVKAKSAAEVFEAGARMEWRRITGPEWPTTWGTA